MFAPQRASENQTTPTGMNCGDSAKNSNRSHSQWGSHVTTRAAGGWTDFSNGVVLGRCLCMWPKVVDCHGPLAQAFDRFSVRLLQGKKGELLRMFGSLGQVANANTFQLEEWWTQLKYARINMIHIYIYGHPLKTNVTVLDFQFHTSQDIHWRFLH